ncbi:MAG: cysteine-rich CWC family protein [Betaproteobacteria bacterium]
MAVCSLCGERFTCGMRETSAPCWCASLPLLSAIDSLKDCLCPDCLSARLREQPALTLPADNGDRG